MDTYHCKMYVLYALSLNLAVPALAWFRIAPETKLGSNHHDVNIVSKSQNFITKAPASFKLFHILSSVTWRVFFIFGNASVDYTCVYPDASSFHYQLFNN